MSKEEHELKYVATVDESGFKSGMEKIKKSGEEASEKLGNDFKKSTDSIKKNTKKAAKSTKVELGGSLKDLEDTFLSLSSVAKIALVAGIVAGTKKAADAMKELADEAGNAEVALKALASTSRAYGQDTLKANEYVQILREDGLLSLEQSARTLQNLMGAGFSIDEAFQLAKSMKDIGAFNNIVGDLGAAMEDSSKGIKTNSVELMENIGLTIRLGNLVDGQIDLVNSAEQRQAVYNAILEDGNKFSGDAIRLTEEYNGKLAKMETSWKNLKVAMGEGIKPELEETYSWLDKIFKKMTDITKERNKLAEFNEVYAPLAREYEAEALRTGGNTQDARARAAARAQQIIDQRNNTSMTPEEEQESIQDYAVSSSKPGTKKISPKDAEEERLQKIADARSAFAIKENERKAKALQDEAAYQEEQLALVDAGMLSEKEYLDRMTIYRHSKKSEELANEIALIEERKAFYEGMGLTEEVASLEVLLAQKEVEQLQEIEDQKKALREGQLAAEEEHLEEKKALAEREQEILKEKAQIEDDYNSEVFSIKKAGVAIAAEAASKLLSGELKSLSELGKFMTKKLGVLSLAEAEEAVVRGYVDYTKGASYAADIVTAPLAPPLFAAAKKEFVLAAKLGAAGAALTAVSGSSSEELGDARKEQQEKEDSENFEKIAEENKKKTVIHVGSEELWSVVYHSTKKFAEDGDVEYILTRG